MYKKWTRDEEQILFDLYSNKYNEDISKILNKSISSIENKSHKMGLLKSKEFKSRYMTIKNKESGRDLNYEKLKNIAKNYKSRGEFQREDSSAYSTASRQEILDDICSHMIKLSYSIPQLILFELCKKFIGGNIKYNDRKTIKPYELDIFIPKYNLAFEYDGKGWHQNNDNDEIKNNKCKKDNITLIRFIENNRRYEDDIKNQFIKNLPILNKITNLNIIEKDILSYVNINYSDGILDEQSIKKIIKKYNYYKDFRENEMNLYQKLIKMNKLDEYTKDLVKSRINWNQQKIDLEISKYIWLFDFIEKSNGCYIYIKRNNLSYKIEHLKRKRIKKKGK